MKANPALPLLIIIVAAFAELDPKPNAADQTPPSRLFQTPFQTESQFIIESVIADLAEQTFYAARRRLPEKKSFSVTAAEKPGSPPESPIYDVRIRLEPTARDVKLELDVNGPIWSPAIYANAAEALARAAGLRVAGTNASSDTKLLEQLLGISAETIERENQALSAALEKDFADPALHEEAALLLGTFALRDNSGIFYEISSPLCRMTAHLAMARLLRGGKEYGINGRFAEATLLTLINDQTAALGELTALTNKDAAAEAMVRALRAFITGDFRVLDKIRNRSPLEHIAWFSAVVGSVNVSAAWAKLSEAQRGTIDFVRIATEHEYSVQMGHQFLASLIPMELQQAQTVYELSRHEKLPSGGLIRALNEAPGRCFTRSPAGKLSVRIIGWGQWAYFLQRHLCNAIQQDHYFIGYKWNAGDYAKEFLEQAARDYAGLRLFPFVRLIEHGDGDSSRQSVDNCLKVVAAAPELAPTLCWNYLYFRTCGAKELLALPERFIRGWRDHYPPPGTDYAIRWDDPILYQSPDAVARLEKLHGLAPCDCNIGIMIVSKKYKNHPTYEQAMAIYRKALPYTVYAWRAVAETVRDNPDLYETLMLEAAQMDPTCFFMLGDYAASRHDDDKAALFYDRACEDYPDAVRVSNCAVWRVRHCLKKGQREKAREIAEEASEVYSRRGLEAMGIYLEAVANYDGAYDMYSRIEERYNNSDALIDFCLRRKEATGGSKWDAALQTRLSKIFPRGIERVSAADFHGAPADGAELIQQNHTVLASGLNKGDIIVGVYGVRVRNLQQYHYLRASQKRVDLDLIVWHGNAYREVKCSPPHRLFGVLFGNYHPKRLFKN